MLASVFVSTLTAALVIWALFASPLGLVPDHWNPVRPLALDAPITPFTRVKLWALEDEPQACKMLLSEMGNVPLDDRIESPVCHVRDAVRLSKLSQARLSAMDTRCSMAVRLFLWEKHSLQPAARAHLGTSIKSIHHYSSFACRPIRTSRGLSSRMSEHATANAIDISGFSTSDGRRIDLRRDWDGDPAEAAFLREIRDGLCRWFTAVLSPDYNALHADHFHVDQGRWPTCR